MNKITTDTFSLAVLLILSTFSFAQDNFKKDSSRLFEPDKENIRFTTNVELEETRQRKSEGLDNTRTAERQNYPQEKINKYEVGFQITWHRQKSYNEKSPVFDVISGVTGRIRFPSTCCQTEFGFGGRFTYNFNRNFAVEIEANFFPVDRLNPRSREAIRIFGTNDFIRGSVEPQGRKLQAFAGPKFGIRKEKFGVFGKVRPGIYWVFKYPRVLILVPNPPSFIGSARDWVGFFAVDVGGVFEYYPTKKTIIRFDVGDTIVNYRALEPKPFNPGFTRHTFQFSTGFGFRF